MTKKISEISADKQSMDLDVEKLSLAGTMGALVSKREYLSEIIDEPCLASCYDLYDKNIRTVGSSANKNDLNSFANIVIDYDSLSEENKEVAKFLNEKGLIELDLIDNPNVLAARSFNFKIPLDNDSTVDEVSSEFLKLSSFFKQQDILYGRNTKEHYFSNEKFIETLVEYNLLTPDDEGNVKEADVIKAICEYTGNIFDNETGEFWVNEELIQKHREYIKTIKDNDLEI